MAKILVVCYSRTGVTEGVAREVAKALGADFDRIEDTTSRTGPIGFLAAALEAAARGVPAIQTHRDPAAYDLVVLATPTWAGTMSSPMRTYLLLHRAALRNIATITTMRGHGAEQAQREMLALCESSHVPQVTFTEREIRRQAHRHLMTVFLQQIRQTLKERELTQSAA